MTLLFYQYASLLVKKRLCSIICRVIVVHVCYRSTPDSSCHSAGVLIIFSVKTKSVFSKRYSNRHIRSIVETFDTLVTFSLRILVVGEKCNLTGEYCQKGFMSE